MRSFVVLRLSSMGDVLLTLPVLKGIIDSNPDVQLVFVTRKRFASYFKGITRLILIEFEPDGRHKGLKGIFTLFKDIRSHEFISVVDLHGILRTWILDSLFRLNGFRTYRIKKHRKIRHDIIKKRRSGIFVPHTIGRYMEVFNKAGLYGDIATKIFQPESGEAKLEEENGKVIRIGLAPMSKHITKEWGLSNILELIDIVRLNYHAELHLFGGVEDQEALKVITGTDIINHAGKTGPEQEIALMQSFNLFISMDSANMHMASLVGIPTLSIWGATDPKLGFAPVNQPEDYSLFADPSVVTCRPCSVYGETPCSRADFPMLCMTSIKPEQVFKKIKKILDQHIRI